MELDPSILPDFDNHELLAAAIDKSCGLKAFISIHSTALGPATGGTRYRFYNSDKEAVSDALRLSKAMTYKCALANLPFGGGKSVIVGNKKYGKPPELLIAYAKKINLYGGNFTTGEDVGIGGPELRILQKASPYINGTSSTGGSLSFWAAEGVYWAIRAALKFAYGNDRIAGKKFAVKGLGKVGSRLSALLLADGGDVTGADIDPNRRKAAQKTTPGLRLAATSGIHKRKVDVFCPCAFGTDLDEKTIPELDCRIVCGAANNQLSDKNSDYLLHRAGVTYVPDFVANAGGLIRASADIKHHKKDESWVKAKVKDIFGTVSGLLALAATHNQPTNFAAEKLAKEKVAAGKKINPQFVYAQR